MNQNKDYEFVSAAMDDDDLSEEALDKLLSDSEAQQKWHEYHLIRDCLQRAKPAVRKENVFVAEESIKVAVQTVAAKQLDRSAEHARRPAANHAFKGFAVAASVLAVAVGVWQFWPQTNGGAAAVAEKAAPSGQSEIVSVGGKTAPAKNDAVANAEAQGTVVPNAARANQAAGAAEKQSAVRVEKLPETGAASAAK
ncbi:sigma-E factor negative regulatory protein [Neisseria dentiae]|uniref:sigma-E factor negative regulatory protein n=1 Tax=Neisseria dentiae TaxID=194197 RepID=UPI0035A00E2A